MTRCFATPGSRGLFRDCETLNLVKVFLQLKDHAAPPHPVPDPPDPSTGLSVGCGAAVQAAAAAGASTSSCIIIWTSEERTEIGLIVVNVIQSI